VIALVDRPPVVPGTVHDLTHALLTSPPEVWAVIPETRRGEEAVHGHPVVIGRDMIEAFLRAPADSSARDVEHRQQQHVRYMAIDDPRIVINVNTPEDYDRLRSANLITSETAF